MIKITHKFIDKFPDKLDNGVIYISKEYSTAIHKCCCGCGNEVVTPLSPTGWKLTSDGKTISLYPSIGNWNFDCRSHYWITNNEVIWADKEKKPFMYPSIEMRKSSSRFWWIIIVGFIILLILFFVIRFQK